MELITRRLSLKDVNADWAKSVSEKYGIKEEDVQLVRKGLVPSDTKFDTNEKASVDYITTKSKDRDNELVLPQGGILSDYEKNPVVLWAHDYKQLPLGKSLWIKSDARGLISKTKYHTRPGTMGEKVWQYRSDGFPLAKSIGFVPLQWHEKDEFRDVDWKAFGVDEKDLLGVDRVYTKWLMLEYSDVPVPSNADCVQLAISKGLFTKEEAKDLGVDLDDVADSMVKGLIGVISKEAEAMSTPFDAQPISPEDLQKEIDETEEKVDSCTCPDCGATYEPTDGACGICPECESDDDKGCGGGKRKPKKEALHIEVDDATKEEVKEAFQKPDGGMLRIEAGNITKEPQFKFKERWNKSLSKLFDVEREPSTPVGLEMTLLCKFLECKVKNVYQNDFAIPMTMLGSYLHAFKSVSEKFKLKDTRSIYYGSEYPPSYETIQINSKVFDDFLVEGIDFYDVDGKAMAIKFSPGWSAMHVSIFTHKNDKEINKKVIADVRTFLKENHPMKGEKFAINGQFLEVNKSDDWDTIILDEKVEKAVKMTSSMINKKGGELNSRGVLMVGPAGTGKTKASRIMMSQTDSTFVWVSSKDFTSIGSTYGLKLAFDTARDLAPSILLMEDIDNWLDGGNMDLLKTELDGIRKNTGVVTILTTNFPDKLPDALLDRPGRFHDVLKFDHPTDEVREKMVKTWLSDADDETVKQIVESTAGYSGAYMWELIQFAKDLREEDEQLDIREALVESLQKLEDQRELVREIRGHGQKGLQVDDGVSVPQDGAKAVNKAVSDEDTATVKVTEDSPQHPLEDEPSFVIEKDATPVSKTINSIDIEILTKSLEEMLQEKMKEVSFDPDELLVEAIKTVKGEMF